MTKHYLIALFLVLFLSACADKEEPVIPTAPATWVEHPVFTLDQRTQLNSYADEDQLLILGLNSMHRISGPTNAVSRAKIYALDNATTYKYPLSSNVIAVAASASSVVVYPPHYPNFDTATRINLKEIDPTFQAFAFIPAWLGESIKISSKNVCLIPYQSSSEQSVLKVLRVKFAIQKSSTQSDPDALSIISTEILSIPEFYPSSLYLFEEFDNKFYLSGSQNLWSIADSGEPTLLLDRTAYKMFKQNNRLFAIAFDGLYSSANGTSWANSGTVAAKTFETMNYVSLSNTLLIGYKNDQLFHVNLLENKIYELDNTGMKGHAITSISQFKDKVYLTTFSGVFTKDSADFLTPKEN